MTGRRTIANTLWVLTRGPNGEVPDPTTHDFSEFDWDIEGPGYQVIGYNSFRPSINGPVLQLHGGDLLAYTVDGISWLSSDSSDDLGVAFTAGHATFTRYDILYYIITDRTAGTHTFGVFNGTPGDDLDQTFLAFRATASNYQIDLTVFAVPALAADWSDCTQIEYPDGNVTLAWRPWATPLIAHSVYVDETFNLRNLRIASAAGQEGQFFVQRGDDGDDHVFQVFVAPAEGDDLVRLFNSNGLIYSERPAIDATSDTWDAGEIQAVKAMLVALGIATQTQ